MPQIEHDPSPTPQRATLKFDPVFKWPWPAGRLLSGRRDTGVSVPLQFFGTFNKFWSSKATSVYRCWRNSCNTASHKRSGLSSPVFASSIIRLAIRSLIRLPWSPSCRAARAMSNAMPMTRLVSGSNSELFKNWVMGTTWPPLLAMELYADPACQSGDGLGGFDSQQKSERMNLPPEDAE